ncbi:hypothetical protein IWW38_003859 [Coemansia aciculifera]|uniref:Uncharacterized protein n=1 Tax=Coemansia aciculifera TaxID=417176 RepID=A0ACC1M183_9FUNG|nr:hypothetical protein IWW38_003859 [Coemansia aciculifera]
MKLIDTSVALCATAIPTISSAALPTHPAQPGAQELNAHAIDFYRYRRDNIPDDHHLNARALDFYRY